MAGLIFLKKGVERVKSCPNYRGLVTSFAAFVVGSVALVPTQSLGHVFTGGSIVIQDNDLASPFPSWIEVSGLSGTVVDIRVRLNGFTHGQADNVDVFLAGPNNTFTALFSDAGDFFQVFNENLLFTDDAENVIPFDSPLFSGTYRPANYVGNAESSEDKPLGMTEVASLRALASGGINGDWGLYVSDDTSGRSGSIESWELIIETHRVAAAGAMLAGRRNHTTTFLPDGRILVTGGSNASGTLSSAEVFDPGNGQWSTVGDLTIPRSRHSAVLLPSGSVLIAGGINGSTTLASAELFDPTTDSFSPVGNLGQSRASHSVTLLADGRILVAGGNDVVTQRSTAEVFDPATMTWSSTGSLNTARSGHTATLLQDGRVLVVGGSGFATSIFPPTLASAEIFDPATGAWSMTGSLTVSRSSHGATRLPDGRVAVTGGGTRSSFTFSPLASIEIFDPSTGLWSTAGNLGSARFGASDTLLPDGRILVLGGTTGSFALASSEIFDPGTGVTLPGAALLSPRDGHSATMLPGGRILLCGGSDASNYPNTAEIYDPTVASWRNVADAPTRRIRNTATLLADGRVLVVAGAESQVGRVATAEIYDPATNSWSVTGSLSAAREWHTATLMNDGRVLVAGGWGSPSALSSAEIFDPVTGTWSSTDDLSTPRTEHTATLLRNGQVLLAGGTDSQNRMDSLELFDPLSNTWTFAGKMEVARLEHTATLLTDGRVLFTGGYDDTFNLTASAEIYDPSTGQSTPVGSMALPRQRHEANLLHDGRVLITDGYTGTQTAEIFDPKTETWSPVPDIPADIFLHTAITMTNGMVVLVGERQAQATAIFDPTTNSWFTVQPPNMSRSELTATLLLDGRILITGGATTSTEVYNIFNGLSASLRPAIQSLEFQPDSALVLTGSRLRGQGASGGGVSDSSTDYPLIQLRYLDSGFTVYLRPDPEVGFSDTGFVSGPRLPYAGHVMVTAFVNGVPSESKILLSSISRFQDFDGDGLNDAAETLFAHLGLDPIVSQPGLVAALGTQLSEVGYYDQAAFDDNFAAGQADVINDPNSFNLYTPTQIQALNIGVPLLSKDESTGQFTLTIGVERSRNLDSDSFSLFPMSPATTVINAEGELEFTFSEVEDISFFRVYSK